MPNPSSGSSAATAISAPSSHATKPSPNDGDDARASALQRFVQLQAPRFTAEDALEVVRTLGITPREDEKELAKRLREALKVRRIALKHVNSLHAAAQLLGSKSWHTVAPGTPQLQFTKFDGDASRLQDAAFASWSDLAVALREWADQLKARGEFPLRVLAMSFVGRTLSFSVPASSISDPEMPERNEMWPVAAVTPMDSESPEWLSGASAALEKLRRHLEENGTAVLDGHAVLYLCATSQDQPGAVLSVSEADVANSELVLLREVDEDDPNSTYEIARGDELTCWHQLEISLNDLHTGAKPSAIELSVPTDGAGAWLVNGHRYVWALETLKPKDYVPGRILRQLGIPDCERLLHRYKLAKRIHSDGFRHHDMTKRVEYLNGTTKSWRVDLHRLLHMLSDAGLTWDGYFEKFDAEPLLMKSRLPVGFVMQLLADLEVRDPNRVFAWPTLAEMELVTDDRLLGSLLPRVDTVRYAQPNDLDPVAAEDLRNVIDDFGSSLHFHKTVEAGAVPMNTELPYYCHAASARQLRLNAESLGLRLYLAVSPHLISTKDVLKPVPDVKMWPFAMGHALILRFEHLGASQ